MKDLHDWNVTSIGAIDDILEPLRTTGNSSLLQYWRCCQGCCTSMTSSATLETTIHSLPSPQATYTLIRFQHDQNTYRRQRQDKMRH